MGRGEGKKYVQFALPTPLFEQFYKAFPGKGERSFFLERLVVQVLEKKREKEVPEFLQEILDEVEEEYA